MANSLTALNRELWAKEMQLMREKSLTAKFVTDYKTVADGDRINKPYRNKLKAVDYTKGTDLTMQDITATNEYLDVDQIKAVPIFIDKIDQVQNSYNTRREYAKDMQFDLNRGIDAKVLSEYDNATSDVDDADFGGSSGTSVTVDPSNVNRLFTAAGRKLTNYRVSPQGRFAVISPSVLENLQLYLGGKDTDFGEKVGMNGYVGSRFGFEIFVSQNLTYTARWTPADNPTADATITINGVVLTFKASPASAGEVDIGTDTATTIDNIVTLLNAPGTTTATGIAVSAADQVKLEGIVATDGTTYLGIEHVGGGEITVATSESADPWSKQTVHCLFGQKKAITLGVQALPNVGFNQEPKLIPGSGNLIAWTLYGVKTFADGADALVDVNVVYT